jgi:NADPH:quinone reductase-like Zn-dependent oxidoreductase
MVPARLRGRWQSKWLNCKDPYAGESDGCTKANKSTRSGLEVIATCSSKSTELVRSHGADHVYDYQDSDCASKIRTFTNDDLHFALSCVGDENSIRICGEALSSHCNSWIPNLVSMFPIPKIRDGVSAQAMLAYTAFGEEFVRMGGNYFPPMKAHYEHAMKMWHVIPQLIADGKVKPHPHAIRSGGLSGIADG